MQQTAHKVVVIGHRNPDTDSICSAIAYAELKNKTSDLVCEARRDGDTIRISARSDSLARRVEYYKATSARQDRYADSLKESLAETREAYDRLLEVSRHQSSETAIQQTRSPAYRGRWMLFGIVIGCLGSWWAHKTNLFAKLFKTI